MPELPDLHIFSENLKKRILNKNITLVTEYDPRKLLTPGQFCKKLTGTSITDIVRDGKELRFVLKNDNCFSVHLMLSGKFFIEDYEAAEKISSKIIGFCFEDRQSLVITGFRKLCKITLNPKPSKAPDAMSDKFTFEYFLSAIKRESWGNVKAVLTDQNVVRGIGNAYADEILWKAEISPKSTAGKIPVEKLKDLYEAIPFVFNDAIQNIRKISPDIISGEERSFLRVHNSHKKFTEDGSAIIKEIIASKNTYYTKEQKLYSI